MDDASGDVLLKIGGAVLGTGLAGGGAWASIKATGAWLAKRDEKRDADREAANAALVRAKDNEIARLVADNTALRTDNKALSDALVAKGDRDLERMIGSVNRLADEIHDALDKGGHHGT